MPTCEIWADNLSRRQIDGFLAVLRGSTRRPLSAAVLINPASASQLAQASCDLGAGSRLHPVARRTEHPETARAPPPDPPESPHQKPKSPYPNLLRPPHPAAPIHKPHGHPGHLAVSTHPRKVQQPHHREDRPAPARPPQSAIEYLRAA